MNSKQRMLNILNEINDTETSIANLRHNMDSGHHILAGEYLSLIECMKRQYTLLGFAAAEFLREENTTGTKQICMLSGQEV